MSQAVGNDAHQGRGAPGETAPWPARMRDWIDAKVLPHANAWEEAQAMPLSVLKEFAAAGWLGATVPTEWGGLGLDSLALGQVCAHMARGSVSLLSMFTVHSMVCQALLRFGDEARKKTYLPKLAKGGLRAAFALTEPERGSEATGLTCAVARTGEGFSITGKKRWISGSTHADLFLVMARLGSEGLVALLVPADSKGLTVTPMPNLLGFRAAGIAELAFEDCRVPRDALVGPVGGGFTFVASHALDCGRYIVGWGGVGILDGCLAASTAYASEREQFGQPLRKHQLIQELIADMATDLAAAQALAEQAAAERDSLTPDSVMRTSTFKYFSSRAAFRAATNALQLHGGNGCSPDYPLMRYFRDAKICEIIEGSSQMQQLLIASAALMRRRRRGRKARG